MAIAREELSAMGRQIDQLTGIVSRRVMLQSLAGCVFAMSAGGCASSAQSGGSTSSRTVVATPTARPMGSVLYTYRGHTQRATAVAWSLDGRYIASGSLDKTVQVWAANPGDHVRPYVYRGHTDSVYAVDWSPDSRRVVSGSSDRTVQVWDAFSGKDSAVYRGHTDLVTTVAWSPDGNYVASGSVDGTVRLWEVATGSQRYVYRGHTAGVNSVVWSPDSQRVASGSADHTVHILEAATGKQIYIYRGHSDVVSSVSWSPDGERIASGSFDKTVQVWKATTRAVSYVYRGYNVEEAQYNSDKGVLPDIILAVAWSHSGKRIAAVTQVYCGDSCGVVVTWDADTERNFAFYINVPVFALAWSPDDTRFATSIVVSTQDRPQTSVDGSFVQISQA